MIKNPVCTPGFTMIFPNFKHGKRKDGLGLPSLSPKFIGPIDHGQPGLPISKNLENFHQGNKVFKSEVDETGEPTAEFFERQIEMYNDAFPWRHKFHKYKQLAAPKGNKNIPEYSVWIDEEETVNHISYVESRQFYCHFYEMAMTTNKEFVKLKTMIDEGMNLQICGYDAYETDTDKNSLERCYLDSSKPFGHELVLFSMLVLNKEDYPWTKHTTYNIQHLD